MNITLIYDGFIHFIFINTMYLFGKPYQIKGIIRMRFVLLMLKNAYDI